MTRIIHISSFFLHHETTANMHREIWHRTRDMDSIVSVTEMARTGDGRKFIVVGTPR